MNLDPIEKFFKRTNTVKLDQKKKDAIHQELLLFMKKNPFGQTIAKKPWFGFSIPVINSVKLPAFALMSVMLFLFVGGAVTNNVNAALPGDSLYAIKGFSEKIKETLAFSDESKLKLNISLAQTRLQEAQQLTLQGKLDSSNENAINNNFKEHANQASEYIHKINQTKDNKKLETIAANFEASLKAQSIIMDGLQKSANNNVATPLINDINNAASDISSINTDIHASSDANVKTINKEKVIRDKISSVEDSVKAVKKLIENNKEKIGSEAVSQSENNLNLVQRKIDESKNRISKDGDNSSDDYQSMVSSLQQASIIAQESKYLIDAKTKLKVNIPINISSPDNK